MSTNTPLGVMLLYVIFFVMSLGYAQALPAKLSLVNSRLSDTPHIQSDVDQDAPRTSSFRVAFSMIPPIRETERERDFPTLRRPERYCSSNSTRHENICIRRLTAKVTRLENAISSLLSAIVHADDIALNERFSYKMGRVYKDAHLQSSRRPRMLRQNVQNVANMYNIWVQPIATNWIHEEIMAEIGQNAGVEVSANDDTVEE